MQTSEVHPSRVESGPLAVCASPRDGLLHRGGWPIQDMVLFLAFCARINTILCAPTLCVGTPPRLTLWAFVHESILLFAHPPFV